MLYKEWINEENIMNRKKFLEELENKISEAMETALEYSKKVKSGNIKTDILNTEYWMGQYHAYESLMQDLDWYKFVELHEKYNKAWFECQNVIDKLYH